MFFMLTNFCRAEILFEDNFNQQSDWRNTCLVCGKTSSGYNGGADLDGIPTGWSYWRADEYWNKDMITGFGSFNSATPGADPVMRISNEQPYGPEGKSIIFTNESESNSPNGGGGGWASDGILTFITPTDYPEISVQFKAKFKPNFNRYWTASDSGQLKFFRIEHWDRAGSPYDAFANGHIGPAGLMTLSQNEYGGAMSSDSIRCNPVDTESHYKCNGLNPGTKYYFTGTGWPTSAPFNDGGARGIWDGNWHTIQLHLKLNSAPGISDGWYEIIYDGALVKSVKTIPFILDGGDINAGWNLISIGGNTFNNYMQITDHIFRAGAEQWYAIDDVVVSTGLITNDYVIGLTIIPPAAPSGLNVE